MNLAKVFSETDLQKQAFHLAQAPVYLQILRPCQHLSQAFDIGRQPAKTMRGKLFLLHCFAGYTAINSHAIRHHISGRGQNIFDHRYCILAAFQQVWKDHFGLRFVVHGIHLTAVGHLNMLRRTFIFVRLRRP